MIKYISGDLFTSKANAYAHGCNTLGYMGAGIAKQFRDKFPENYEFYKKYCLTYKDAECGKICFTYDNNRSPKYIFNLFTQERIGPNAKYLYVANCFDYMKYLSINWKIESIAIPHVGCGLGNLKWSIVRELLEECFNNSEILIEVYSR